MGNRLSQHKVTKVRPVEDPEDTGLEEGDDENELVDSDQATETGKGSRSSKKKEEEEIDQPLKAAKEKAPNQEKEKQKVRVEQVSLFGEPVAPKAAVKKPEPTKKASSERKQKEQGVKPTVFTAGQTIELEL
jgi:topoisomerase-4 subunit A